MKYFDVYLDENNELQQKSITVVKREALSQALANNESQEKIDTLITQHLQFIDNDRIAAQAWYEQYQLTLTLDPTEPNTTITTQNAQGVDIVTTVLSPYKQALASRKAMETANTWLKGLRGLVAPARPVFVADVAKFKLDNVELFKTYNKALGVNINGVMVSLNESNQHGLADISVMIDKAISLGQLIFPITNLKLETATGIHVFVVNDQTEFDTLFLTFGLARVAIV